MKLIIYIQEAENPEEGFTSAECAILRKFDQVISSSWVSTSNSTSNLRWLLEHETTQQHRTAILVTVDHRRTIHREPLYSLKTKSTDAFANEFIQAANAFSHNKT